MRAFVQFSLIVLFLLCLTPLTFAHQFKSDNGVTVMLHVQPDDAPIGGTTTPMNFTFTEVPDGFSIDACTCTLTIVSYKEIDAIERAGVAFPIDTTNIVYGTTYRLEHIFPKRDVYALVLEGTPKDSAVFEPFRITYDLRVETMAKTVSRSIPIDQQFVSSIHVSYLFLALVVILLGILCGVGVKLHNFKCKSK